MNISIKDLLKCSKNIKTELISSNDVNWVAKVSGEYKEMNNSEKAFSNKQLSQLATLIEEIIDKKVPPIVERIVDQKLEPIKKDIELIKNCPTIKRELSL